MIDRIDSVILGFFTRVSHRFQRLTGRTNFFLAKVFLLGMSSHPFLGFVNYWVPILPKKGSALDLILLIIVIDFFRMASACDKAEAAAWGEKPAIPPLPLYIQNPKIRCVSFFALIALVSWEFVFRFHGMPTFFQATSIAFGLSLAIVIYLLAVRPLPPGTSKVREWLGSLLSGFRKPTFAVERS